MIKDFEDRSKSGELNQALIKTETIHNMREYFRDNLGQTLPTRRRLSANLGEEDVTKIGNNLRTFLREKCSCDCNFCK